jgi:hypothetical protein
MSTTIVQKLKVIAENKMRSDSASAKIILEAANIIENKFSKKEELSEDPDKAAKGRIWTYSCTITYKKEYFYFLHSSKKQKIIEICHFFDTYIAKMSESKSKFLIEIQNDYKSKLAKTIELLAKEGFKIEKL